MRNAPHPPQTSILRHGTVCEVHLGDIHGRFVIYHIITNIFGVSNLYKYFDSPKLFVVFSKFLSDMIQKRGQNSIGFEYDSSNKFKYSRNYNDIMEKYTIIIEKDNEGWLVSEVV